MLTFLISQLYADELSQVARVEKASLSQQVLLEMVVEHLNDKNLFCGDDSEFLDVCSWSGIVCDQGGVIVSVHWSTTIESFFPRAGTIALEWIPNPTRNFDVYLNGLSGTLTIKLLPNSLRFLDVSSNSLSGKIELSDLPQHITSFDIASNCFSGSIRLDSLPKALEFLDVSRNAFTGGLRLTDIPTELQCMRLQFNKFEGFVHVDDSIANIIVDVRGAKIEEILHVGGKSSFVHQIYLEEYNIQSFSRSA